METNKRTRAALYLRVSTDGQTVANQERELREVAEAKGWTIVETYSDKGISGSKGRDGRPGLDKALRDAVQARYDVLAAWSVDRLGRSLQDLLNGLNELQGAGRDLYLHRQAIDTRTPSGRAMFQMLGVFAEFERAMIQERVRAGMSRAKENGTKSGRPIGRPPTSPAVESRIRRERRRGHGILKIARNLRVGVSVVQRVLDTAQMTKGRRSLDAAI